MKTFTVLLIGLFCLGSFSASAQDYITVYYDGDYGGSSHRLYDGEYRADELGVGNDKISSIRIPSGFRITVYSDDNFRGRSRDFSSSVRRMPSDFNDKISSIRVERRYGGNNYGSSNTVTLYEDGNFRGQSYDYTATGRWSAKDAFPNDRISSIRVPRGRQITVYVDDRQQGYSRTFTSDVRALDYSLNDKISSIDIERANNSSGASKKPIRNKYGSTNKAVLFADCDFRGRSMELGQGAYKANSLRGIGNDQLSSMRLPSGWEAVLYMDDNFRGEKTTIYADFGCLPYAFNDRVSSIIIRQRQN